MSLTSPSIHSENTLSDLQSPVEAVQTATPAFIGYTEKAFRDNPTDLVCSPVMIHSLAEYEAFFGKAKPESESLRVHITEETGQVSITANPGKLSPFLLYYSVELYFLNGGGPCYIVSAGSYESGSVNIVELETALHSAAEAEDVTILAIPDAFNLPDPADYYDLFSTAAEQCAEKKNRFLLMDIPGPGQTKETLSLFRSMTDDWDNNKLQNVAAYYPSVFCAIPFILDEEAIRVEPAGTKTGMTNIMAVRKNNSSLAEKIVNAVKALEMQLPVSAAIAAKMVYTDLTQGVWKAPAGMPIDFANRPAALINENELEQNHFDPATGRAVNIIRSLPGHGNAVIWGAHTMSGSEDELRYIPVRRTCMMIEKSLANAAAQMAAHPDNVSSWTSFKQKAENFLYGLWRQGAMSASKPEEAFFVKVGPGITMTENDILLGIMIAEIGVSLLKPAEFILLRIIQQMSTPGDIWKLQTSQRLEDLQITVESRLKLVELVKVSPIEISQKPEPSPYVLFQGNRGTGRKRSAAIIGQMTGKDVYRIDVSMIISKYTGETEKNIDELFRTAEGKNWILYFDEADALFYRSTDPEDTNDRYEKEAIAYLLQKLNHYEGSVIFGVTNAPQPDSALCQKLESIIIFDPNQ